MHQSDGVRQNILYAFQTIKGKNIRINEKKLLFQVTVGYYVKYINMAYLVDGVHAVVKQFTTFYHPSKH